MRLDENQEQKDGLKAMMWSYKDSALTLMERKEESQEAQEKEIVGSGVLGSQEATLNES